MKKIVTLFLTLVIVLSVGVTACKNSGSDASDGSSSNEESREPIIPQYARVDEDGNESKTGKYLLFGSYPQSDVTNETGTILAESVELPTDENSNGWTSYKYYIQDKNDQDFTWYKDVEYNNEKYRAVYFTEYRPFKTTENGSENNRQENNGYITGNVYWFKFEPIKWKILSSTDVRATILSEMILDSQPYNYSVYSVTEDRVIYPNRYDRSSVRAWLNNDFYNTAFNTLEKAEINTVEVENGVASANPYLYPGYFNNGINEYACVNTYDKVWLSSMQEVTKNDYGFDVKTGTSATRQKKTTAYSRCQGAWTSKTTEYAGNGIFWLRSPFHYDGSYAHYVDYDGYISYHQVHSTDYGVVPALEIML